jgi:sialic acid synthase
MLSPGNGFKWVERDLVIGKKAKKDIPANEVFLANDLL